VPKSCPLGLERRQTSKPKDILEQVIERTADPQLIGYATLMSARKKQRWRLSAIAAEKAEFLGQLFC
jgi:hypothetical protein